MEIHPFCQECLSKHKKWKLHKDAVWLIGADGRPSVQICNLIKEKINLSDGVKSQFKPEELEMLDILYDPLKWSSLEFKWKARWYQETMLLCSAFRKVNRIGRRAGKCFSYGEEIALRSGERVPVETLIGKKEIVNTYDQDDSSFSESLAFFSENGVRDVYKITLDDGTELERTGNHPLLTVVGWKDISDIKVGEKVAVPLKIDRFGDARLDDDAIKIAAYIIGDGNTTQRNLRFSSASVRILEDLSGSLSKYGAELKKYKSSHVYDYHIVLTGEVQGENVRDLMRRLNLSDKNSHNKRVPREIMMSSAESVRLFLNRIFSTDGWASEKSIGYCSVNRKLVDDIFELLLRFGIRGRRRTRKVKLNGKEFVASEINITDKNSIINFRNNINIFSKENAVENTYRRFFSRGDSSRFFDHYGKEVWGYFSRAVRAALRSKYGLRPEYGPHKRVLNKALEDMDISFSEFANDNIGWSSVKRVEYLGKRPTVSVYVERHNTIITDVIEHNTETLCVKMLHYAYTRENTTSLVVAPYKNQVGLIFDKLDMFLGSSPGIKASIKRNTKNPYRLEFYNGSKIVGFTSGTRTGSKSTGIRGQDAHAIFIDEADFLGESDFEVILAILASRPDCYLWASSTPTGKREMYWKWCVNENLGFKEFFYKSNVSPSWTKETELLERAMYSDQGYAHEFEAEFGEEAEGVFLNKHIDSALIKYSLGRIAKNDNSLYTIGVDWNTSETGTPIVVTEWNQDLNEGNGAFRPVEKVIISQTEFTQTKACEKIIELNEKWNPVAIYVDEGFGYAQIEMLHKYGMKNLDSGLVQRVKGINFSDKIEIRDPASRQLVKKHVKPFMVNICVKRLEDGHIILPEAEDLKHGLVGQMRDYTVIRRTSVGQPIFRDEDDHTLVAFMLSILAATMERSDMLRLNIVPHIAIGGRFGEKVSNDFVLNKNRTEEQKRKNAAVIPRWPVKEGFFKDKSLKSLLDIQKYRKMGNKQRIGSSREQYRERLRRQAKTGKVGRASY